MKRTLLTAAFLACVLPFCACSLFGSGTSPPVANTVEAAGDTAHAAAPILAAFVKTANCTQTCRDTIATYNHEIRTDLDAGLTAELAGDNAAVGVALREFNTHYGSLWSFMAGAGAPLS